jgi:ABC-type uncharacterized transport system substrate-binding protein
MIFDSNKIAVFLSQEGISHKGEINPHSASKQDSNHTKRSLYFILLIAAFTLAGKVCATESSILILLSSNDDVYLDVATTITNSTIKMCRNRGLACQDANYEISQVSSQEHDYSHNLKMIVTLGIKAAVYAKNNFNGNLIFSALIPKNNQIPPDSDSNNSNHYYLYLDQPLHRSMLLINALSDSFKNIGVMIGKNDKTSEQELKQSAAELDITLNLEKIDNRNDIGTSLYRLLSNSDILLAVPDTEIHNKSTVSNILISAYRKRKPLIGFSSAYVKAGALAAIYSSHEDIAFHVRDNIVKSFSGESITEREQSAAYFSILFNSEVARSLDFPTQSVYELESKMIKRSADGYDYD